MNQTYKVSESLLSFLIAAEDLIGFFGEGLATTIYSTASPIPFIHTFSQSIHLSGDVGLSMPNP